MQNERNEGNFPDAERQGWQAEELAEEASLLESDEITRQILRGDETEGNPDERDVAGGVASSDTPHGRKEVKHKTGSRA